jgi:nucleotide-binding universal stress UspA family protein
MDRDSVQRPIGNLVVGTDFAHHSHDAVARAAWLPISPGCRVTLVHALPPGMPRHVEQQVREVATALMHAAEETLLAERGRCGDPPFEVSLVIETAPPAELLACEARDRRAELVVVGRGRRHGLEERILGSQAERIVRASHVSVLVARSTPEGRHRRPLVAVDLGESSPLAVQWALRLASPETLDLVHAFEAPYLPLLSESGWSSSDVQALLADLENEARQKLAGWTARLPELGVKWQGRVVFGDARRVIRQEAAGSDLIVAGTHGRTGAARFLLGSVAESLVRAADCDLLIVR